MRPAPVANDGQPAQPSGQDVRQHGQVGLRLYLAAQQVLVACALPL